MRFSHGFLLALLVVLFPLRAQAWQEAHQARQDARMTVTSDGKAKVELTIAQRVVRGPFRSFDLRPIDKTVHPAPEVTIDGPDGKALTGELTPIDGGLRVTVHEPRLLSRGTFVFHIQYDVDLRASRALTEDGPFARLEWTAPTVTEGIDGSRFVFEFPPGKSEPRALTPSEETGAAIEQARTAEVDTLTIVRPHVARTEAVNFVLRVDPLAVGAPARAAQGPVSATLPRATEPRLSQRNALALLPIALLFPLFALVHQRRERHRRPLIPLQPGLRLALGTLFFSAGCVVPWLGTPRTGAGLVALSVLLTMTRDVCERRARGPASWTELPSLPDARPRQRSVWVMLCALGVTAAIAFALLDKTRPDVMLLLLIPVSGLLVWLRPSSGPRHTPLGDTFAVLAPTLNTKVWGRIPKGESKPEELRLVVTPEHDVVDGFVRLEIGAPEVISGGGAAQSLELLLRVQEDSPAKVVARSLSPYPPVLGQTPSQCAIRIRPSAPTPLAILSTVQRIFATLRRYDAPSQKTVVSTTGPWTPPSPPHAQRPRSLPSLPLSS